MEQLELLMAWREPLLRAGQVLLIILLAWLAQRIRSTSSAQVAGSTAKASAPSRIAPSWETTCSAGTKRLSSSRIPRLLTWRSSLMTRPRNQGRVYLGCRGLAHQVCP